MKESGFLKVMGHKSYWICRQASFSVHFLCDAIWVSSRYALDTISSQISRFECGAGPVISRSTFCWGSLPGSQTLLSTIAHAVIFGAVYFCSTSGGTCTLRQRPLLRSLLKACTVGILCDNIVVWILCHTRPLLPFPSPRYPDACKRTCVW